MTNKETLKIFVKQISPSQSIFTCTPLASGFGIRLGNALRYAMFAFQESYAITSVTFHPHAEHEFSILEGVSEDVQEIILRLKKIRLKKIVEHPEDKILVSLENQSIFTGKHIAAASSSFDILNPEQVICHLDPNIKVKFELSVSQGKGYITVQESKPVEQVFGSFPIDAVYTPIVNVQMKVEDILIGNRTNYEKLVMEIATDGSITPEEALKNAAKLLGDTFVAIENQEVATKFFQDEQIEAIEKNKLQINKLLTTPLSETSLSARVVNCLNKGGYHLLKDIVGKSESDLTSITNFGKKCHQELEDFLKEKNLTDIIRKQ